MPRKARINIKSCYCHIMVQGINKSYIFNKDEDARKYIYFLYEIKKDYEINIVTYCVMSNHCHILLKFKENEVMSCFMKRVNLNYAIYYNKKYNRVGYVFRDRFKSQGIFSEKQLYNCINYIYNNPVKAGICKEPKEYPYLNYKANMYDINMIDDSFEFIDIKEENRNYEEIVNDYIIKNNLNISKDKNDLIKLVKYLKKVEKISFRKMEEIIGLGRETLRNLLK